jgi:tryptophan-rich sensory protein
MSSRSNINWFQVTIWILLVEMIGMASALLSGNIREMYHSLTLPAFSPSGGVFGIVWPILYLFIGIVGYITWQNRQTHVVNATLFLAQLLLNFLWTIVFFNGSLFTIGVIIILVMDIVVALLIKRSLPISQTAASYWSPTWHGCCLPPTWRPEWLYSTIETVRVTKSAAYPVRGHFGYFPPQSARSCPHFQ